MRSRVSYPSRADDEAAFYWIGVLLQSWLYSGTFQEGGQEKENVYSFGS